MDIKMASNSMDILVEGSDLQIVEGKDATVQYLKQVLSAFKGEWFLNIEFGIDYHGKVLIKDPDPNVLETIFKEAILSVPGVLEIIEFQLLVDPATREYEIDFTCSTIDGDVKFNEEI